MKKLSLCLMSVFGIFITACNSGTPSNNVPSGCPNGASQCGATHPTSNYSQAIPSAGANAKLISVNNLVLASTTSQIPLTFEAESLSSDTTITFTTNNGTLGTPTSNLDASNSISVTFHAPAESVVLLLNTTSANSYTITPAGMPELTVNTLTPVNLNMPNGTYSLSGKSLQFGGYEGVCYQDYFEYTTVKSGSIIYACSNYYKECYVDNYLTEMYQKMTMPSYIDENYFGDNGYMMYSNSEWLNGVFSFNMSSNLCPGMISGQKFTYQSSSTVLPYNIVSNNK